MMQANSSDASVISRNALTPQTQIEPFQTEIQRGEANFLSGISSEESSIRICRVSLKNSLLCMAMPCEVKAAHIRNGTISDMEANKVDLVCARYLQNRRGARNTQIEAMIVGSIGLTMIALGAYGRSPLCLSVAVFYLLNVPPNLGNYQRYQETKEGCEHFLRERIGGNLVEQLDQIEYSQEGFPRLRRLLVAHGIQDNSLDNYNVSRRFHRHCLDCYKI